MYSKRWLAGLIFLFMFVSIPAPTQMAADPVEIQPSACSDMARRALTSIGAACDNLDRNSACYGFFNVLASFNQPVAPDFFSRPSERADLGAIASLRTAAFDMASNQWGVAVMRIQANIPETLPGQAVTLVLLGDAQIADASDPATQTPMQAFTLSTGIGAPQCREVPPSTLTIQAPRGITVDLTVNGAEIRIGSTAVIHTTEDQRMVVSMLSGRGHMGERSMPRGYKMSCDLDEDGMFIEGSWSDVEPFDEDDLLFFSAFEDWGWEFLDYPFDAPDEEELAWLYAFDLDLLLALDPYAFDALIDALIEAGYSADLIAGLAADDVFLFLLDHLDLLDPELADAFWDALFDEDGDFLLADLLGDDFDWDSFGWDDDWDANWHDDDEFLDNGDDYTGEDWDDNAGIDDMAEDWHDGGDDLTGDDAGWDDGE
ncbi:MAG: hypothetical protein SNJ59_12490 [Aggregatilineales bacterium]